MLATKELHRMQGINGVDLGAGVGVGRGTGPPKYVAGKLISIPPKYKVHLLRAFVHVILWYNSLIDFYSSLTVSM